MALAANATGEKSFNENLRAGAEAPVAANQGKERDEGRRRIVSLDGQWQIAEGGMEAVPEKCEREVVVPGLVDLATPPFVDPGPKVTDREAMPQKDPRRDAFWYRCTFDLPDPIPAVARLKQRGVEALPGAAHALACGEADLAYVGLCVLRASKKSPPRGGSATSARR